MDRDDGYQRVRMINIAYLASSAIAAFASLNSRARSSAFWWLSLSIGILALELLRTEQAGLWMDDHLGRGLLVMGWYGRRRPLQVTCIVAFALGLLIALRRLRPIDARRPLTVANWAFYALAVFAAIRSSSLHWSDAVLELHIGSVTLSHATQILLLVATSAAAFFDLCSTSSWGRLANAK